LEAPHGAERPILSARLAALDLALTDAALSAAIGDEAQHLFDAERAIVWRYRPALGRLFAEQEGEDLRALELTPVEAHDILRESSSWSPEAVGMRRRLVEASFGMAGEEHPSPVLAVPLTAAKEPMGILLLRTRDWEWAGRVLADVEPFAKQAGALLANNEELREAHDHELQLRALYETAGEISSKLELETVLTAIVERARALTDAPIAYIQLVDQSAGEIYMRVAVGVSTPEFERIRLRLGAGLGGTVAQQRAAFYTSDYLNDTRFSHDAAVDDAVRGEGIKSILGVPMKAFDTFVGVLYVADEIMRTFTVGEIDVLSSLADHAALAIENARLYERATAALGELERTSALVQERNRRLEHAGQLHRQLSEIVLAGHGLPAVVDLMSQLVGEPATILDEHMRLVAAAGTPSDAFGKGLASHGLGARSRGDDEIAGALAALDRLTTCIVSPRPPHRVRPRLVVPIVAGAQLLGSVWIEARPEAIDEEQIMLEQAVRVVGLELLKERSLVEAERRLRRELLEELLGPLRADGAPVRRRALELGVDLDRGYRLAVAGLSFDRRREEDLGVTIRVRERLVSALRHEPWCDFAGESSGRVVALVQPDASSLESGLARIADEVRAEGAAVRIVLSEPCPDLDAYRANFVAAGRVLQLFAQVPEGPAVVELETARALTLLFREGGEPRLDRFAGDVLRPILEQRPGVRQELLRTLEAYLDRGRSPSRTAAALNVHVNTVYYRLERLRALLGADFASPHRSLDFQIGLRAYRLTGNGLEKSS
jgi:GAF domain-containing protein